MLWPFLFLSSDNLNISSELDVFKPFAFYMMNCTLVHRKQQLLRLMKYVRLPSMRQVELFRCDEVTSFLTEYDECMQLILEAN